MKTLYLSWLTPACLAVALAALGCGGNVVGSGGSAGSSGSAGSGGTAGAGGTTTTTTTEIPAECSVPSADPGPFAVTFQFTNPTAQPLYLFEDCLLSYFVTGCDTGYVEQLGLSGACTVDCSDSMTCIECGACPAVALQVTSAMPLTDTWSGLTYTFGQTSSGCSCHTEHVAPAQKYHISVPVYSSEQDAIAGTVLFQSEVDFTLPAPNGIVEVTLQPPK